MTHRCPPRAHNKVGWPCTSCGPATAVRCCSCTGWRALAGGGARRTSTPGRARCGGSTSPGTATPTSPSGRRLLCEVLMGDVDIALAHLGAGHDLGRGLGAYIGLLLPAGGPAEPTCGARSWPTGRGWPAAALARLARHRHRGRRAAARRHARPLGPPRAHPRRPPARLRRHLRPPGRRPARASTPPSRSSASTGPRGSRPSSPSPASSSAASPRPWRCSPP